MNFFSKPIQVILVGSLGLALFVLLGLKAIDFLSGVEISSWFYFVFPVLVALLSFLLFSFLIERFINQKIKGIYKTISHHKIYKSRNVKLNEDVLETLSKDTEEWAGLKQQQIEELERQASFRREFLGNLAHELKTPVFSIQGYILTLLEGGLEDDSVNRVFLDKALNGVERITSVLDDLDDIAKFEFDRFKLKMVNFNIVGLAQEVFDTLESKASDRKIRLMFAKEYDPILVNADKGKIGQVLINLVSNSVAYGSENGSTTIKFSRIEKKKVLVEVIDDGLGIEESHFTRLFERFYRVEKSRARNLAGSGLGLSIVKHIVEAHGQIISVKSTPGEGSVFSFTLDVA